MHRLTNWSGGCWADRAFGSLKTAWLFVALAALSVVLFGCSSTDKPSQGYGATGIVADSRNAAILQSYDAYWDALLKASDPPDPNAPVLRDHASGVELGRAVEALRARQKSGERLRGSYQHASRITEANDILATVADCLTPQVFVSRDGQKSGFGDSAGMSSVLPISVTALLINRGQTWKVERIDKEKTPCLKPVNSKPIASVTRLSVGLSADSSR